MEKNKGRDRNKGPSAEPGLQVVENKCVWMKAGVVNFRLCDRDYDCFHCPFDRGMRRAMDAQVPENEKRPGTTWAERMRRKYMGAYKPCRFSLTGEIDFFQNCDRDYECDGCPVNLALEYRPMIKSIEAERNTKKRAAPGVNRFLSDTEAEKEGPGEPFQRQECVWMRAGIINFKLCHRDYDCYHCEFDQSMRAAMGQNQTRKKAVWPKWSTSIKERYEIALEPCIYYLRGFADATMECTENHACYRCAYHQRQLLKEVVQPPEEPKYTYALGYRLAEGYYYHFGHSWLHPEKAGRVRIGIDDFLAKLFGPPEFIELPPKGAVLKKGETGFVIRRNGHSGAVRSPVSGKVIALNEEAVNSPNLCHEDPYRKGWLLYLRPEILTLELDSLYFGKERFEWMERENQYLLNLLGTGYERLAATGGKPLDDLFGQTPGLGWDKLAETFLRTKERLSSSPWT